MKYKNAIVRKPAPTMIKGISQAKTGRPDYQKALIQHKHYIEALKKCGVKVTVLEPDPEFPDSMFVEDPAVVTKKMAIITNPGASSRRGEKIKIREVLKNFYPDNIEEIIPPATLEGGDVMQIENHFYVGLSERTNKDGARQFLELIEKYGYTGSVVKLNDILHLKTGIAYIGNNTLVTREEFTANPLFAEYNYILIREEEKYAANCIRVNDYVLIPEGYPETRKSIEKAGFDTISIEVSEFKKLDGGLSCLSLRF